MALFDLIGAPQIAALLLLAQRGLEELYSAHNTSRCWPPAPMKRRGSTIPSSPRPISPGSPLCSFSISPDAPIIWPLIAYYLALQVVRYWVIASLGRFWTHRIITLPGGPIARDGPYRYLPHPNYAVTIIETFVLPLAFGALALAIIMTALWWTVLDTKIKLEDEALRPRRSS